MKKNVLWSLSCWYNNPTPSEAIIPPASQARQSAGYLALGIQILQAVHIRLILERQSPQIQ